MGSLNTTIIFRIITITRMCFPCFTLPPARSIYVCFDLLILTIAQVQIWVNFDKLSCDLFLLVLYLAHKSVTIFMTFITFCSGLYIKVIHGSPISMSRCRHVVSDTFLIYLLFVNCVVVMHM
jgi:hypothetical protein